MKIASPLSRKATLVSVDISQWSARKYDKKITDEVNQSRGATDDAGRYNKLLIQAERLSRLTSLVAQARKLHYKYTKPWCDAGLRILPNTLHKKFAEEFRVLKREFDEAADEFCNDYPKFVAERKRALNGLFNQDDYPSPEEIRGKFRLATKTFPVPEADDFRSDVLDDDTMADIKRELEQTAIEVDTSALKDSARQVAELVGHMAEKLKTYTGNKKDGYFGDSLVNNLRELVELLPHFNLNDDPALDRITTRIAKELCIEEPDTLRDNKNVRASVQASADEILKDVSALLG
jgi:hypothetical protein